MAVLYFAYGSNLDVERMVARVPSARRRGAARLDGHRLAFDKRGADGSGKASLALEAGTSVWGALYAIAPADWPRLDDFEPGYARTKVTVVSRGRWLTAQTYVAVHRTRRPVPFDWYKRLVLDGARAHRLPAAYLAALARRPALRDPDA